MKRQPQGRSLSVTMVMLAVLLCSALATAMTPSGPLDRPVIKASALYLIELQSGRVLLEKNATRRLPPASLTKIMTALIALESAPLHEVVKIHPRSIVHHSSYNFQPGEEFLLRDLLTAMLVASANDACEAIAWHVGGDADKFVTLMNKRALTLGLTNTHFANACGFDALDHYSTAVELARLTGVKTGYTNKAGHCLIASMFKENHHLVLVGLNLVNQWEQAVQLLRYGHAVLRTGSE